MSQRSKGRADDEKQNRDRSSSPEPVRPKSRADKLSKKLITEKIDSGKNLGSFF